MPSVQVREPELIDYLHVLWRWKGMIGTTVLAAILAAAAVGSRLEHGFIASQTFDVGLPRGDTARALADFVSSSQRRAAKLGPLTVMEAVPGTIRLEATGPNAEVARQRLRQLSDQAADSLARLVEVERDRIAAVQQEEVWLRSFIEKLRAAQLDGLNRKDPIGLLLFQGVTAEVTRAQARLAAIYPILASPSPDLSVSAVAVRRAEGLSVRLLVFVALLGAFALSTLLAFFLDYLQFAHAGRPPPGLGRTEPGQTESQGL